MPSDRPAIKYRYAEDENGAVVDIFGLTEKDRKDYICLGCDRVLRPALGEIRKKHFRHKVDDNCSQETYLHRMGIYLFHKTYQDCINQNNKFTLETPVKNVCHCCEEGPCNQPETSTICDLSSKYRQSIIEKRDLISDDIFIPDIMLYDGNFNKIYIEIAVSHKSSQKKVDSGIPIIEIEIAKEEDLGLLTSNKLSFKDNRIKFFNFKDQVSNVDVTDRCTILKTKKSNLQIDKKIKEEIKSIYLDCLDKRLPFNIVIKRPVKCCFCSGGPCSTGTREEIFDLTSKFENIDEEGPGLNEQNKRIAIYSKTGRRIYFEYTNVYNARKQNDEFKLNAEVFEVTGHYDGRNTACYNSFNLRNLHTKDIRHDDPMNCVKKVNAFIINRRGKARIDTISFQEYEKLKNDENIFIKQVSIVNHDVFIKEVECAYNDKFFIKNCYLCRYHAGANNFSKVYDNQRGGIFCKYLKITCTSNRAHKCDAYRPDPAVFGSDRYPEWPRWR